MAKLRLRDRWAVFRRALVDEAYERLRFRVGLAFVSGLITIGMKIVIEDHVHDPVRKAAANGACDLVIVIVVGIVLTEIVDVHAVARDARRERQLEAEERRHLLEALVLGLRLGSFHWARRSEHSAMEGKDLLDVFIDEAHEEIVGIEEFECRIGETRAFADCVPLFLLEVHGTAAEYWWEGGRVKGIRSLVGLRDSLRTVADHEASTREQFTHFTICVDRAVAATLWTDAVVQERLVVELVSSAMPGSPMIDTPEASAAIRSVAELAGGVDGVLTIVACAGVLGRMDAELRSAGPLPSGWESDVLGALNRCMGALANEAANYRLALSSLIAVVNAVKVSSQQLDGTR